jgi:hypothetical protein
VAVVMGAAKAIAGEIASTAAAIRDLRNIGVSFRQLAGKNFQQLERTLRNRS